MLSEWLTAILAIDASSDLGSDIGRPPCHRHDQRKLRGEDGEDEDEDEEKKKGEEDEMQAATMSVE